MAELLSLVYVAAIRALAPILRGIHGRGWAASLVCEALGNEGATTKGPAKGGAIGSRKTIARRVAGDGHGDFQAQKCTVDDAGARLRYLMGPGLAEIRSGKRGHKAVAAMTAGEIATGGGRDLGTGETVSHAKTIRPGLLKYSLRLRVCRITTSRCWPRGT